MTDGHDGLVLQLTCSLLFPGFLERVLAWYVSYHKLSDISILILRYFHQPKWYLPELASSFQSVSVLITSVGQCKPFVSQAAKDSRASQDTLIDIFECIEMFFRRLEIYTEVPPTLEMMDMVVRIMAEVLSILGIAMKEIKQGRMSKCSVIRVRQC